MEPVAGPLRLYGSVSKHPPPPWSWVEGRLVDTPVLWVVAGRAAARHPRPVWGVWSSGELYLSIGTPVIRRALETDPLVCVHAESGTDVVVLHGRAEPAPGAVAAIAAYDAKYDWRYDEATYGPLTRVRPEEAIAWRTAGWAGRDGFTEAGRWWWPATPPEAPEAAR
jgi:hypothetical protein